MLKLSSLFLSSLMSRMKMHNFVLFSWVCPIIWMCNILSFMNPISSDKHAFLLETSILLFVCFLVKSMRFISNILLIYHHVRVLINMKSWKRWNISVSSYIARFGLLYWLMTILLVQESDATYGCEEDEDTEDRRKIIYSLGYVG